jgi:uncharacterized protein
MPGAQVIFRIRLVAFALAFALFACPARAALAWESLHLTSAVTDQSGVLSFSQKTSLENHLSAYQRGSGNAIAVVILRDLDGGDVDDAANRIFEKNGIGAKGKDNGLLILVAIQDRRMRIEVGYGLEDKITDAIAKRIVEADMVPAFRQGAYYEGIAAAVTRIEKILGGDASAVPQNHSGKAPPLAVILFIVAILVLSRIFGGRGRGRGIYIGSGGFGGGFGGGGGFSGGGGFGGFGGGGSGGGGASGGW